MRESAPRFLGRGMWLLGMVVMATAIGATYLRRDRVSATTAGMPALIILPLEGKTVSRATRQALAESLAARLRSKLGVDAEVRPRSSNAADGVLEISVDSAVEGSSVLLRLRPAGTHSSAWTATFWRRSLLEPGLADDLAVAVGEALGVRAAGAPTTLPPSTRDDR